MPYEPVKLEPVVIESHEDYIERTLGIKKASEVVEVAPTESAPIKETPKPASEPVLDVYEQQKRRYYEMMAQAQGQVNPFIHGLGGLSAMAASVPSPFATGLLGGLFGAGKQGVK